MSAFSAEVAYWHNRRGKLGDGAVGRKGEDFIKQGHRIAELLSPEMTKYAEHGLDFGCGWGRLISLISRTCGHVWAVDILDDWVLRAEQAAPNATGICLREPTLPLESASIDRLVDVMSLQSARDEGIHLVVCRELKRVLAPGAQILSLSLASDPLRERRMQLLGLTEHTDVRSTTVDQAGDEYCLLVGTKM